MTQAGQVFNLLRDIEVRSRQKALGLPQKVEMRRTWSGIGFRLGPHKLVSPTDEIVEVLKYPSVTRVPSALSWVKGLANIRGMLLPVMDLGEFVDGKPTELNRAARVLMIRQGGLVSGLLVDEVMGLRHFFEEERTNQLPEVSPGLRGFLKGSFKQGEARWGLFSMRTLAGNPKFMEVALRS